MLFHKRRQDMGTLPVKIFYGFAYPIAKILDALTAILTLGFYDSYLDSRVSSIRMHSHIKLVRKQNPEIWEAYDEQAGKPSH